MSMTMLSALSPAILLYLWTALVILGLCAVFSAAEAAFTSLTPQQIARLELAHPGRLLFWKESEERVLATILVWTNLTTVGMGSLAAALALELSGLIPQKTAVLKVAVTGLFGILTLLYGAILPKVASRQEPEKWALRLAPFIRFFHWLMGPFTRALMRGVKKLGGRRSSGSHSTAKPLSAWELKEILSRTALPHESKRILANLIEFTSLPVRMVMTTREEIFYVDIRRRAPEIMEAVFKSPYSRIPAVRGSLDNVVGMVYSRDLLLAWRSQALVVLEDLLRPVRFVHPDAPLADSLRVFRLGHQHMNLVKDPSGRIRGLLTLQDALEAIVGHVPNEEESRPPQLRF